MTELRQPTTVAIRKDYVALLGGDVSCALVLSLLIYWYMPRKFKTQKWSVLARANAGYPCWSRDGQYVYFLQMPPDPGVLRVGIRDRKVEQVASLKGFQMTGYFGLWLGIAPDDSPLLLKDTGTQEIVSLDWQAP
jgi:hypothetical protein